MGWAEAVYDKLRVQMCQYTSLLAMHSLIGCISKKTELRL